MIVKIDYLLQSCFRIITHACMRLFGQVFGRILFSWGHYCSSPRSYEEGMQQQQQQERSKTFGSNGAEMGG